MMLREAAAMKRYLGADESKTRMRVVMITMFHREKECGFQRRELVRRRCAPGLKVILNVI